MYKLLTVAAGAAAASTFVAYNNQWLKSRANVAPPPPSAVLVSDAPPDPLRALKRGASAALSCSGGTLGLVVGGTFYTASFTQGGAALALRAGGENDNPLSWVIGLEALGSAWLAERLMSLSDADRAACADALGALGGARTSTSEEIDKYLDGRINSEIGRQYLEQAIRSALLYKNNPRGGCNQMTWDIPNHGVFMRATYRDASPPQHPTGQALRSFWTHFRVDELPLTGDLQLHRAQASQPSQLKTDACQYDLHIELSPDKGRTWHDFISWPPAPPTTPGPGLPPGP